MLSLLMGLVVAIAIAVWQGIDASRAKTELKRVIQGVPDEVVKSLHTIIRVANQDIKYEPQVRGGLPINIQYEDVDNDGRKEILIQYPAGAHGSNLKVFKWDGEFIDIGWLGVGTPVGFQFGDFDGDGKIEIRTEETDWSAGLCYAEAPRVTLIYRWNGTSFEEILPTRAKSS